MGIAGIVLSLVLLIYLAYRGVSVLVLAPLCALLAVLLDGNLPLLATYTQIFMSSVGQFVASFFPLFLLGAILGKLMEDCGAAAKIASAVTASVGTQRAALAIVISCSILTYGGVSLFVVVFAIFPLARSLFRQADIPRRLIPGTIALGAFTYTMTAARDGADSESDSDAVLPHHCIRGTGTWMYRRCRDVCARDAMAQRSHHGGAAARRRLWPSPSR